jgi:hypothetical protein
MRIALASLAGDGSRRAKGVVASPPLPLRSLRERVCFRGSAVA